MPRRERRLVLWSAIVASVAMLLWMGRSVVSGEIPFTGDLLHWNYPLRDFFATAVGSGQRLWWMPTMFGGFDVAGEGQLGEFHPLHWVLYGLLPLDRAFAIELVLPYLAMFAGTWLFLGCRVDSGAAAFGAMLFTFCGFNLSHVVHMNMVAVVAHIPWLLWTSERLVAATTARGRLVLGAVCAALIGSQLLFGHPQAVWWSALLLSSHGVWLAATTPRDTRRAQLTTLAAGACVGMGIGAVQLVATWYEARHSERSNADLNFVTSFSLEPRQLLQFIEPYATWGRVLRWNEAPGAGDEFAVYAGVVPLALAAWWVAAAGCRRRHRLAHVGGLAWWALAVAALGLWLALGRYGGLYYLQTLLPLVGQFRAPVRYVLFSQFGLAVVSAVALVQLTWAGRDPSRPGRGGLWAPWLLVGVSAAVAYWLRMDRHIPAPSSMWVSVAGPALLATAAVLITLAVSGRRVAVAGLVLLAAVDLGLYGLGGVVAWQDFLTRSQAVALVEGERVGIPTSDGRIARGGFPNLWVLAGYRLIDGYAGLTPRRTLDYTGANALRVAGVRYAHRDFLGAADIPGAQPLPRGWFRLPAPLPRAHLVTSARASSDERRDIERVDVSTTALVSHPLDLDGSAAGSLALALDEPGHIVVTTDTESRQLLVLSESFSDGWSTTIDDRVGETERVNGDFLGVVVPPGRHTVRATFAPPGMRVGGTLTLGSAMLLMLVGLRLFASYRRSAMRVGGDDTGSRPSVTAPIR